YRLLAGGFISNATWQAQTREVVLNKTAAFQLFGGNEVVGQTLKLGNESWLVSGVLDDKNTITPCIYAPASVTGGEADSLLVLMDKTAVNADYAKNALKQLGIYEHNYVIVNLATASATFDQRLIVGFKIILILIIILLLRYCLKSLAKRLPLYREQLKQLYPSELLTKHFSALIKTALAALALLGGLAVLLILALQILATCLSWQNLLPPGHDWAMGSFADKLAWLHIWYPVGICLFLLLLIVLSLTLLFACGKKQR
ncbi:MAG: ABC transporter permease, partial [Clostridiales bacterium]|nr:ABC transporter permease [Clostridiales bacterium]